MSRVWEETDNREHGIELRDADELQTGPYDPAEAKPGTGVVNSFALYDTGSLISASTMTRIPKSRSERVH